MILVSPTGRYDRHAVVLRAKELYSDGRCSWGDAMSQAYREASAQLRAVFNHRGRNPVAISREDAHV